ncbi:hypothetical protein PANT_5c00063 [Moesziomyces antarcticus T-34]|uniref:Uncharacterized protein n=1 Tax=Pseudozyma antarctica (strain T-34) TaxID=1151754 RepID=M9LXS7_PSEA3|nr:hypothetical protein PANT_5c00063 [Moesziomyces antarcticus T-34]
MCVWGRPGSASIDADGHAELGGMGKRQVNDSAAERHADLHATDVDFGSDADVARLAATRIDFSSDSELAGGEAEEGKKNKLLPSWQVSRRCLQLLRRLLRVGSLAGGSASPIDRRVVHAVLACQHWHPEPRNAGLHWQTCWRADGEPSGALPLLACAAAAAPALLDRCRLPMHARPRVVVGTMRPPLHNACRRLWRSSTAASAGGTLQQHSSPSSSYADGSCA